MNYEESGFWGKVNAFPVRAHDFFHRHKVAVVILFTLLAAGMPLNVYVSLVRPHAVLAGPSTQSSIPDTTFPITNSGVNVETFDGNHTLYLGGTFTEIGYYTGYGVPLDATPTTANPHPKSPYAKVNNTVRAVVSDRAGGWYIGGDFTEIDGSPYNCIAHIKANGTADTAFMASIASTQVSMGCGDIASLVLSHDGLTLYAGGQFTSADGGTKRNSLAAFDPTTGSLKSFDPQLTEQGASVGLGVNTLILSPDDSILYIGGYFNPTMSSVTYNNAIAFTTGGGNTATLIPGWNPNLRVTLSFAAQRVFAFAIDATGSTIYIGGTFDTVHDNTCNCDVHVSNLAQFSSAGNLVNWSPNPTQGGTSNLGSVSSLALSSDGSKIYVGGSFAQVQNPSGSRVCLAAFGTSSSAALPWAPFIGDGDWQHGCYIDALTILGSTIYVGGGFQTTKDTSGNTLIRNFTAAFGIDTTVASGNLQNWNPSASDAVVALANDGNNTVYAGGLFSFVNAIDRSALAAVNLTDNSIDTWGPIMWNNFSNNNGSGQVNNLVFSPDKQTLYVGGTFTGVKPGGILSSSITHRESIAAFTVDPTTIGTVNPTWDPAPGGGVINFPTISDIVVTSDGNTVYAAGDFTSVNTTATSKNINYVAGFQSVGTAGTATGFNANLSYTFSPCCGSATALFLDTYNGNPDGVLYVGGYFDRVNGSTVRNHIAVFFTSDSSLGVWNPSFSYGVFKIKKYNSLLYIAGGPEAPDAAHSPCLSRYTIDPNSAASVDQSWRPFQNCEFVNDFIFTGATVMTGGNFTYIDNANTVLRDSVAEFNFSDASLTSWDPNLTLWGDIGGNDVQTLFFNNGSVYVGGGFTHQSANRIYAQTNLTQFNPLVSSTPASTSTSTPSPTGTSTVTPTHSPTATPSSTSTSTSTPTSTITSTTTATVTTTPTVPAKASGGGGSPQLPNTATSWPGIFTALGGFILTVGGAILATL